MFTTNTGEKTIRANQIVFLGKALRSQPEKYHGLVNTELKYRERYLDLTTNLDARDKFLKRIKFIKEVRRYLEEQDYLEIETPIMSNHASGAVAKPFTSYHNALDQNVYLRIAPETYLKRAIVGGFTKVFEFARCFRNEGIDTTHLQDFTMLEGYCSYQNYKDSMEFLKKMLQQVIYKVWGSNQIILGNNVIDFSLDWKIYSFRELIIQDCGIDINLYTTSKDLLDEILNQDVGLDVTDEVRKLGRGNLIDLLYKKVSRPKIIQPTFLIKHPTDLSPLARTNDCDAEIADRFQLVINGSEIINAYSELVDPIEQRKRLIQQASDRSNGDEEAMMMDEDYLRAMEYGMPPISGWGIGIDRIMQVLTNSDNIKDVVLFPLLKAK